VNNWNEAIFLTAFLLGDILLIASFLNARQNWRPDLPPYTLQRSALDVLLHPSKYVLPKALPLTRTPQVLGGLLLFVALLALAREAIQEFAH